MPEKGGAALVERTVKTWLGNPISRALLKWVSKRENGKSRLERCLEKYAEIRDELHGIGDSLAYRIVSSALNRGAEAFGISKEEMKEHLKHAIIRRGIANILEGIAVNGVQKPQTCAAPFLIVWDFTHKCNLRCKHCYQDASPEALANELTTEEAKRVIDDFANAGVVAIAFSGGEPLIRKDFFEVASYAKKKDFYVAVATNGTLITREVAQRLKEIVDYVEISLDGFEKTHDEFRGIPGVWKRTCEGIKNCVAVGLDTCVATTVTKWNLKEIPELIDFVEKELGANRMIFFNFVPTRRGKDIAEQDITPQEREELLKFLYSKLIDPNCKLDVFSTAPQYSRIAVEFGEGGIATHFTNKKFLEMMRGKAKALAEFIGGCGCARLYAALEPNGDIYPCVFLPIKVGNIREKSIKEIWSESPILQKLRDRKSFWGVCGTCKYREICGGCRARAYGYFGDVQAPDPGCILNLKYWEELKSKVKK